MLKYLSITILFFLISSQTFAQLDFSKPTSQPHPILLKMDSAILANQYEQITSVLIAQHGKVLFEKYYNGSTETTTHNTRSATKTLATLLTGIAINKGFIQSEQDKIFQYLTHKMPVKNPDARKQDITLEDLLSMSAILECNDFNSFSRGHEERMYVIEDWTGFYLDLPIRSYPFEPAPKDQPYGRSFSYCSAGAATMAEILQVAVGKKLDQFAKEALFEPLKITDYQLDFTPSNLLNTAGGSQYQSRDLLKLIQLCLNQGQWNDEQILPAFWVQKATTPKANVFEGMDYGYFFWLKDFGPNQSYKAFYMSGNGGQKVLAIPALEVSLVITTTNYGNRKAHDYMDEMINRFILPAVAQ